MSETVISVEGLGKKYRLGTLGTGTLRHDLNRWWHQVRGKPDPYSKVGQAEKTVSASQDAGFIPHPSASLRDDEIWALQNVSFEVKRGEVLGIIGRNGAGKSTLLKILSRVTAPTVGEVRVRGRIASLLEVGTGFHPELTGRENIYLNGAILGMTRTEIRKKFDEIVAFAEVEKFLDTPVKRYSSGMHVRLAFAVAAHLEPEILIVDEVLAVGDAEFQKKCLGKMHDVSTKEGRTILFVSHNTLAVQKLCTKAMLLQNGSIKMTGLVDEVLANYSPAEATHIYSSAKVNSQPQIVLAKILTTNPRTDLPLAIMVEWVLPGDLSGVKVGVGFNTLDGQRIFDSVPEDFGLRSPHRKGRYKARFTVPPNTLLARRYGVSIGLWRKSTVFDHPNPALEFCVEAAPIGPYSHQSTRDGFVNLKCDWQFLDEGYEALEQGSTYTSS